MAGHPSANQRAIEKYIALTRPTQGISPAARFLGSLLRLRAVG
jgi:hypothetical protein